MERTMNIRSRAHANNMEPFANAERGDLYWRRAGGKFRFHIRVPLPITMRAKLFRRRAEECAALAKTMTDQLSRRELERTAAHWLGLADGADLLENLEKRRRERG